MRGTSDVPVMKGFLEDFTVKGDGYSAETLPTMDGGATDTGIDHIATDGKKGANAKSGNGATTMSRDVGEVKDGAERDIDSSYVQDVQGNTVAGKGYEAFNSMVNSGVVVKNYGLTRHNVTETLDVIEKSVSQEFETKGWSNFDMTLKCGPTRKKGAAFERELIEKKDFVGDMELKYGSGATQVSAAEAERRNAKAAADAAKTRAEGQYNASINHNRSGGSVETTGPQPTIKPVDRSGGRSGGSVETEPAPGGSRYDRAKSKLRQAGDAAKKYGKQASDYAKANPGKVAGGALGGAALIGAGAYGLSKLRKKPEEA